MKKPQACPNGCIYEDDYTLPTPAVLSTNHTRKGMVEDVCECCSYRSAPYIMRKPIPRTITYYHSGADFHSMNAYGLGGCSRSRAKDLKTDLIAEFTAYKRQLVNPYNEGDKSYAKRFLFFNHYFAYSVPMHKIEMQANGRVIEHSIFSKNVKAKDSFFFDDATKALCRLTFEGKKVAYISRGDNQMALTNQQALELGSALLRWAVTGEKPPLYDEYSIDEYLKENA